MRIFTFFCGPAGLGWLGRDAMVIPTAAGTHAIALHTTIIVIHIVAQNCVCCVLLFPRCLITRRDD